MVCSNSVIFEPEELRSPVLRFHFHTMHEPPREFSIDTKGLPRAKATAVAKTIAFSSWRRVEMKAGGVIGPYKTVGPKKPVPPSELSLICISFVHTPPADVLPLTTQLFTIAQKARKGSMRAGKELLAPLVRDRQQVEFDLSLLADFRERPQFEHVVLCERIQPLVTCPGSIMVTDQVLYFQPASINNVGERISKCVVDGVCLPPACPSHGICPDSHVLCVAACRYPLKNIVRTQRRRYIMREVGLELMLDDGTSVLFAFGNNRHVSVGVGAGNCVFFVLCVPQQASPTDVRGSCLRDLLQRTLVYDVLQAQPAFNTRAAPRLADMTRRWQQRELSNFDYLTFVNRCVPECGLTSQACACFDRCCCAPVLRTARSTTSRSTRCSRGL